MDAKDLIRLPDPRKAVRAELREVIRDVFGKPHVFFRIRLTGWHFPHRAREPFLVVGDLLSRNVIIDRDGLGANAYFDRPLTAAKMVSFGYGNVITWDFDVEIAPHHVLRLDRARLAEGTVDPLSGHI